MCEYVNEWLQQNPLNVNMRVDLLPIITKQSGGLDIVQSFEEISQQDWCFEAAENIIISGVHHRSPNSSKIVLNQLCACYWQSFLMSNYSEGKGNLWKVITTVFPSDEQELGCCPSASQWKQLTERIC